MSGIRRLFKCIGQAVLAQGPKANMGEIPFNGALSGVADALKRLRAKSDAEINAAEAAKTEAPAAWQEAEPVGAEVATDWPPEVRAKLVSYLSLVPDVVRQSLRRPADPTGMTVSSGLPVAWPDQLLPYLPRFKPGDPGADLPPP